MRTLITLLEKLVFLVAGVVLVALAHFSRSHAAEAVIEHDLEPQVRIEVVIKR